MPFQLNLFEETMKPNGLFYISDFISVQEEKDLLAHLQHIEWQQVKMHGVVARRKVAHFGLDYEYSSRNLTPTAKPPRFLSFLLTRVSDLLKIPEKDLAETLISYYPVGAGIGWHRDAPLFDTVIGISLLSDCMMSFRQIGHEKSRKFKQLVERRSAYIMQHDARWKWQHHIPAAKVERYSITFRTLVQ